VSVENTETIELRNLRRIEDELLKLHSKYTNVYRHYSEFHRRHSEFETLYESKQTFERKDLIVKDVLDHLKILKLNAAERLSQKLTNSKQFLKFIYSFIIARIPD
jgi:hypothetical protein